MTRSPGPGSPQPGDPPPSLIAPEWLMAYADGETSSSQTAIIESALNVDAVSRRIAAQFLNDSALLRDACCGASPETQTHGSSPARRATPRSLRGFDAWIRTPGVRAMAAAVALVAVTGIGGFGLGVMSASVAVSPDFDAPSAAIDRQMDGLAAAFESVPNNTIAEWADDGAGFSGSIEPRTTFVDATGRFCRTVHQTVNSPTASATGWATACRDQGGGWRLTDWSLTGTGDSTPFLPVITPPSTV